jgi:hypothetical protein
MSTLVSIVRRWVGFIAGVAAAAGFVSFVVTARHEWAWLAIGGLVSVVASLGLQNWRLSRPQRDRDKVMDGLAFIAREGASQLERAIAGDDVWAAAKTYELWQRKTRIFLVEHMRIVDVALFEGPTGSQFRASKGDMRALASHWEESLVRVHELLRLRDGV